MHNLGVPIGLGVSISSLVWSLFLTDHPRSITCLLSETNITKQRFRSSKDLEFIQAYPDRSPTPEIMASLRDPQAALDKINKSYERLDRYCTPFRFPPRLPFSGDQVFLMPNSFVHLSLENLNMISDQSNQRVQTQQYEVHGNLAYPLEAALVENFVKAIIDDIEEAEYLTWLLLLNAWIGMMVSYLEVNNEILDNCADEQAKEWYSTHFGRIREAKHGPWDLRVSKRLGSGKELPVDMRENPLP